MDRADDAEDREELQDVDEGLAHELVELKRLGPDLLAVLDEHTHRPQGGGEHDGDHGGRPDPPDVPDGLRQEAVRIDQVEHDEKDVETFGLLFRLPPLEVRGHVEQSEASLDDGLLEQLHPSQRLLVGKDEVDRDRIPDAPVVVVQNLLPGPAAVEQLDELPLCLPEHEVLHRLRVLDDEVDVTHLDLTAYPEVLAQSGPLVGRAVPLGQRAGRFLTARRRDECPGTGCAHPASPLREGRARDRSRASAPACEEPRRGSGACRPRFSPSRACRS